MRSSVVSLLFVLMPSLSYASWYADIPKDDEVLTYHGHSKAHKMVPGKSYSMLVWNIFKHKRDGLLADLKALTEKADLAVLQESMVNDTMVPFFQSTTGMGWVSAASWLDKDGSTGVATGTRLAFDSSSFTRSKVREPIVLTPKMILYTVHPLENGESLLLANIHGINFVSTRSFKKQINQMYEVVSRHKGPLIVAGDFNSRNKARWKVLDAFSEKLGLETVQMENQKWEYPIDAILARGITVDRAKILFEYDSSDHKPLWMEFTL